MNKTILRWQLFNQYLFVVILFCGFQVVVSTWETNKCDRLQWPCDNGQCIPLEDRCDGSAHCQDGSDEIAENCIHLFCPRYAFRCAYGACTRGTSRCDGVKNCRDSSDENRYLCGANVFELERKLTGNCRNSTQMQCGSGECIDIENRCDGFKDCSDGSDESVELCSYLFCPSYAFRCGYGGCVPGNAKCNGVADCADGSDEAAELCGLRRKSSKPTKKPVPPMELSGCVIPFNRRALIPQHLSTETFLPLGVRVPTGLPIYFSCEPHYALQGYRQIMCLDSGWMQPVPICARNCAHTTLTKGISTIVHCNYENKNFNCSDNLRIGTKAQISCAPGYRLPKAKPVVNELTCDADGEWDYPKFKCVPQCGLLETDGSEPVALFERHWHVTIYIRSFDASLKRVCGGTIIAPNLIITAASCFLDDTQSFISEAILFNVMLGHHPSVLHKGEYQLEQLYNISEIVLSDKNSILVSKDDSKHEIALLVLVNNIDFAQSAKPICLNQTQPIHGLLEPYENITLNVRQLQDFGVIGKGYAFSQVKGRRHVLTQIVSKLEPSSNQVTVINVNVKFTWMLIKKLMRRYKFIL